MMVMMTAGACFTMFVMVMFVFMMMFFSMVMTASACFTMLVMVVLIAAVLVLAWHLYRKRRAEAVGKPYVYLLAYYIMLTLLTVLILTLFAVGMNGAAILFAAVVYLIMEVVRKRGFRKFWLSGPGMRNF